jgi:hypothetical protein
MATGTMATPVMMTMALLVKTLYAECLFNRAKRTPRLTKVAVFLSVPDNA